jgi:hypothetical protein
MQSGWVIVVRAIKPCENIWEQLNRSKYYNATYAANIGSMCPRIAFIAFSPASRQKASPGHRRLVLLVAGKAQNANSDSPKCP